MGKGSSGGTTTTVNQSNPPPQVMAAYQQALTAAQSAASQPLQQYTGATIAGFTPDQLAAFQSVDNAQNSYAPYLANSSNAIAASQTPLWNNIPQFSAANVDQYQSPYTSDVVGATEAQLNSQNATQQQSVIGNAISSGAWGGDRSAVAQAQLAGQQQLNEAPTIAGLENTGYTNALGEFNTQQQQELSANEANSYLNAQAGFGYGNLASEAEGLPLEGASAQMQTGEQQQALGQSILNVPYEQFEQQQAYPFQTAQYYANIAEGLGSGMGGTTTGTSTSSGASTASQVGGGLLGLGGLIGESGGFSSGSNGSGAGAFSFLNPETWKKGGRIPQYADGGEIPDLSVSYIPTTQAQLQHTMPAALQARVAAASNSQSSPLSSLSGISSLAKMFSKSGGSTPTNTTGGAPTNALDTTTPTLSQITNPLDTFNAAGGDAGDFPLKSGGRTKYAFGGDVLPDVISGIGDVVGSFFGDPGAGNQATEIMSLADNGETKAGFQFERGGRPGFDDGGAAMGGLSPTTAALSTNPFQTSQSRLNGMSAAQLQQYIMQIPPTSPVAAQARQLLQQKRMMPNVGAPVQGGLQQPTQQQPTMNNGGRLRRDDGGDIPSPPDPDEIQARVDLANEIANDQPQAGLSEPQASKQQGGYQVDPWLALATAGFATMAGQSPQAGVNFGRGALAGIQNYGEQEKLASETGLKSRSLDQEAQKMAQQADQFQQEYGQKGKQFEEELELKNKQLQQQQNQFKSGELIKDAWGNVTGRYDPVTQSIVPLAGNNNGMAAPAGTNGAMAMPKNPTTITPQAQPNAAESFQSQGSSNQENVPAAAAAWPEDMKERLVKYPSNMQPMLVEAIQGRIPVDRSHFGNNVMAAQQAVADIDSSFDLSNPTSRLKTANGFSPDGQEGRTITALNTASRHSAQLALNLLQMNNRGGFPGATTWNSVANAYEKSKGEDPMTNANAVLGLYAPEAAKVVRGAGNTSLNEIEEIKNGIPLNGSPQQQLGALANTNDVLLSKADELQNQYNKAMGPIGMQKQIVVPAALQALKDTQSLYQFSKDDQLDTPQAKAVAARLDAYVKWYDKQGGQVGGAGMPPADAIAHLKANPALAPDFEKKYGVPASQFLAQ